MVENIEQIKLKEFYLIGLSLKTKTTNKDGKSGRDCGTLWQQFEKGNYAEKIQDKMGEEIYAVYHQYDGDHTKPFSYFIGYKVQKKTRIPSGLDSLTIMEGNFEKKIARGRMPGCVADVWKQIWVSDLRRAYQADFEVYDERSQDWNNAEVEIYISVK